MAVEDTGIGFSPQEAEKIFHPFIRLHEDVLPDAVGTGLGLSVAQGLVELHGGRIWCTSPGPGKGAAFAFTLPTRDAAARPRRGVRPARRQMV